jgi:hypothetical protein
MRWLIHLKKPNAGFGQRFCFMIKSISFVDLGGILCLNLYLWLLPGPMQIPKSM